MWRKSDDDDYEMCLDMAFKNEFTRLSDGCGWNEF